MCLSPDQFAQFLTLIGPDAVTVIMDGSLLGEAQALWVYFTDVHLWCLVEK